MTSEVKITELQYSEQDVNNYQNGCYFCPNLN